MSIFVNSSMVNQIANNDTLDDPITFAFNVDPGNFIQSVAEFLGFTSFDPNVVTMPQADVDAMIQAIGLWDDLIPRHLVFTPGDDGASITINQVSNMPSGLAGSTYSTLHTIFPNDVDVYLPNSMISYGTSTWVAAVHEFGHALGLQHPGDYNASDSASITYQNDRTYNEDTGLFSIMSYFEPSNVNADIKWTRAEIRTPMIYDILAIQQLYGVDTTTRLGDTTYGFNSNAGPIFTFLSVGAAPVFTIWDAGGDHDRLDASGYSNNQRIDLHEGSMSDIGVHSKYRNCLSYIY